MTERERTKCKNTSKETATGISYGGLGDAQTAMARVANGIPAAMMELQAAMAARAWGRLESSAGSTRTGNLMAPGSTVTGSEE